MTIVLFSQDLAQQYFDSSEQFPIDFDDAWIWLGYSTKQKAEQTLFSYFEDNLDFLTCGLKSSSGGRPSKKIKLSVTCFKELGMIARTEQGKSIRRYFLECERIAKLSIKNQNQPPHLLPLSRDKQLEALKMLKDLQDKNPDDRTEVILKAQLANLVDASQQSEDKPQLLSVTEICQLHGIYIPKGKDNSIGRKVAKAWRSLTHTEPQICNKILDNGHKTNIKIYPPEFFERIVVIAKEYLL